MKKIIIALIFLLPVVVFTVGARKNDKGVMTFTEKVHDFGIVKEDGGPVSVEFPFVNTGEGNIVVYEAKADCGCTVPEYPKKPIAAGKSGVIKVTYNPLGRPGAFDKVITVKSNGKPGKINLKIKGTVVPKNKS